MSFASEVSCPDGDIAFARSVVFFIILNPGLLSIMWSPGYTRIVVLSFLSLFSPATNENLADSNTALWIVLKGFVKELPWFEILSVASRSFEFTYRILPS